MWEAGGGGHRNGQREVSPGQAHPIMQPVWPMRKGSTLPPWRKQTSCGSPAGAPTVPPGQLFPPSLSLLLLPLPSEKLTGVKLDVEEIALTAASQRRKLAVVLEAAGQSLQVEEPQAQWSVESAWGWCRGGGGRAPASYSGCGGCCLEAQHEGDETQPCPQCGHCLLSSEHHTRALVYLVRGALTILLH